MHSKPASSEPVRRVLFPTPQRGDDETPTRSVRRVRPKAELTPIEIDSTPSFRRLVDSSPVPLAVAAAAAAMRAAKSTPNGEPIITDMTRAAEEVVKNSDYNSIRPPQPSPHALSSPRFSTFCAAQSASASLPPLPSPASRPASRVNTLRDNFGQQAPSFATSPPADSAAHRASNPLDMSRRNAILPPVQSLSHIERRRVTTTLFHHLNSRTSGPEKIEPKKVVNLGNSPTPRSQSKFLRLLRPATSIRVDHTIESPVQSRGCLEDANGRIEAVTRANESSEERRKPPQRKVSKDTLETTPENKENVTSRPQTRTQKRSKPEPNPTAPEDSKSRKPKRRKRMSEVLGLQKALESAAWTNSLAVERQTEVIEIPDSFHIRPRAEVSIQPQSKSFREVDVVSKPVQAQDSRQVAKVEKKSKLKKRARSARDPSNQKPTGKTNLAPSTYKKGKRKAVEVKRKRSSLKNVRTKSSSEGKGTASTGSAKTATMKKRMKDSVQMKKGFDRLQKSGSCKEIPASDDQNRVENTKNISSPVSTTSVADSQAPLKKRIAAEQRELSSESRLATTVVPHSRTEARLDKSSRKSTNPKRLSPPT